MIDLPASWGTRYDATDDIVREIAEKTLGAVRTASRDELAALDGIAAFHAAVDDRFTDEAERKDVFTEEFEATCALVAESLLWDTGTRRDPRTGWHLAKHGLHRAKREIVEPAAVAAKIREGILGSGKATLPDIGTFELRTRPERTVTNPQTGKVVTHPAFERIAYTAPIGERPKFIGDARVVEVPGLGVFTRRGTDDIDFEAAESLLRAVREGKRS